jgi:dTDP-4-amino-4,6-dideoxygalactose transaminase
MPGLNYRIDEIRSAIGIEQLKKLDNANLNRKDLVFKYHKELTGIDDLIIPWSSPSMDRTSSYHIFPFYYLKRLIES